MRAPDHWTAPLCPDLGVLKAGDIVLVRARSGYNALVAGQTWLGSHVEHAVWTHAALYAGDGRVYDCTVAEGVQDRSLESYCHDRQLLALRPAGMSSDANRRRALEYCRSQLGKRYQLHKLLVHIANGAKSFENGRFCTNLVLSALAHAEVHLDVGKFCFPFAFAAAAPLPQLSLSWQPIEL